jgi:VanZ family protein
MNEGGFGSKFRLSWLQLCGVLAFTLVVYASLMLPQQVEQMRTGHWFTEHFVGYFVASAIICLGWRRPFLVAVFLSVAAVVLEGLQSLTPSHTPNVFSVLGGASGALLAVLAITVVSTRRRSTLQLGAVARDTYKPVEKVVTKLEV